MSDRTCASDDCDESTQSSRHKYCTKQCQYRQWARNIRNDPDRWQAKLDRQTERRNGASAYEGECDQCGASFTATKEARYCSLECQGESKRWRYLKNDRCKVKYRRCSWCSRLFISRPWYREQCSDRCIEASNPSSSYLLPWVMGWCPVCQEPHVSKWQNSTYCSRACRKRAAADRHNGYDVPREAIFRRDNWKCQLCGKSIPKTKVVPHPKAAVVDHVIPTIEGGSSSPSNLQAAHFLCNSKKAHNVWGDGEQLRLIG